MTELDYPPTRTVDAVEVLHGETVPDPYRWLEDGDLRGIEGRMPD